MTTKDEMLYRLSKISEDNLNEYQQIRLNELKQAVNKYKGAKSVRKLWTIIDNWYQQSSWYNNR